LAPLDLDVFRGKASPPRDDYRPEIHDSDGLFLSTGSGERIWRPLSNPGGLAVFLLYGHQPQRASAWLQR